MEKDKKRSSQSLWELWNSIDIQYDKSIYADLDNVHRKIDYLDFQPSNWQIPQWLRIAAFIALPLLCAFFAYQIATHSARQGMNLMECYVENGKQEQLTLADGTEVWLNSGSSLIYPQRFTGDRRQVYLNGEANFDVAKNPRKPFIVQTHYLSIEALGTKFNVQSYLDMPQTIATLEEGKIKVDTKFGNKASYILSPNEQLIYHNHTQQITERTVDAERISLWKNGYLIFQSASLDEVLHNMGKHFDVVVQFDSGKYEGRTLTIRFSPDETLSDALNIIKEIVKDFNYTLKEKTLFIY